MLYAKMVLYLFAQQTGFHSELHPTIKEQQCTTKKPTLLAETTAPFECNTLKSVSYTTDTQSSAKVTCLNLSTQKDTQRVITYREKYLGICNTIYIILLHHMYIIHIIGQK